jgi:hypothetical protein
VLGQLAAEVNEAMGLFTKFVPRPLFGQLVVDEVPDSIWFCVFEAVTKAIQ